MAVSGDDGSDEQPDRPRHPPAALAPSRRRRERRPLTLHEEPFHVKQEGAHACLTPGLALLSDPALPVSSSRANRTLGTGHRRRSPNRWAGSGPSCARWRSSFTWNHMRRTGGSTPQCSGSRRLGQQDRYRSVHGLPTGVACTYTPGKTPLGVRRPGVQASLLERDRLAPEHCASRSAYPGMVRRRGHTVQVRCA